jgi:hypothetical protein
MENAEHNKVLETLIRPLTFPVAAKLSPEAEAPKEFNRPSQTLEHVADGLTVTHKRGVSRVPTPFFGMRMRPQFPERYGELEEYCGTKDD